MVDPINLGRIARLVGMERDALRDLAERAEYMYRRTIRQTGVKRRVIDIPNAALKAVQRSLHDRVLSTLARGTAVYGISGKGVIANARQHLNQPFMGVLDIADCFPSITVPMVRAALIRAEFDTVAARCITRLVTLRGRLPQGPPSSPAIMNLVLADVDAELESAASDEDCVYSRYMDDICFSGPHDVAPLLRRTRAVLRRHRFATNPQKTQCWGPTDQHTLTKIVVSRTLRPTAEYLSTLRPDIERARDAQGTSIPARLDGRIAWVQSLNPRLGQRLRRSVVAAVASGAKRNPLRQTRS